MFQAKEDVFLEIIRLWMPRGGSSKEELLKLAILKLK
jgi:hypothetical protein